MRGNIKNKAENFEKSRCTFHKEADACDGCLGAVSSRKAKDLSKNATEGALKSEDA